MVEPLIELQDIKKQFPGVLALDGISLKIQPGEIHAIIGENGAGKSTLINILAGELQPDSGVILYQGKPQSIPNARASQAMGIRVVYQELALCPNLTVAENISLSQAATRYAFTPLNRAGITAQAQHALARLGMAQVNVQTQVSHLSVSLQQLVEIAKALSGECRVLVLDEPNSALTSEETEHLFQVLYQLRSQGVAILYVSHRLEEVMRLADRITVLRDGKYIETLDASQATVDQLIEKMVGRAIDALYERHQKPQIRPEVALEVSHLTSGNSVRDVSLDIHSGEVVGIAGLPDSGKDELVSCLFGLQSYERGQVRVNGQVITLKSPSQAIGQGLVLIPADRRGAGALLIMNVIDNISASTLKTVSRGGFLQRGDMRKIAQKYVRDMEIRTSKLTQQMATLSGGNQQKVILSRGLATKPQVLLLHEPTRGIDVGAKAEIYGILQALAAEGAAIGIISSELPELISQCDRILVMHAGEIRGEFSSAEAREEPILACAMGQLTHLPRAEQQA
ncbi:MAG: sugar ABC transporter ATP-binding protein [Anaerolineae bacterium]|nr:sugar ABC transporter ATP-binding protein [Anaerolineae bacterium]